MPVGRTVNAERLGYTDSVGKFTTALGLRNVLTIWIANALHERFQQIDALFIDMNKHGLDGRSNKTYHVVPCDFETPYWFNPQQPLGWMGDSLG